MLWKTELEFWLGNLTSTEILKSLWNDSTEDNTKWFKNESRGILQKKGL